MLQVKQSIRSLIRNLGYDIKKKGQLEYPLNALSQLLLNLDKPELTIFDVGANKGQSAKKYRKLFPDARIYSFEPFPESISILESTFKNDAKWEVIPKAVGSEKGSRTFYVNEHSATNSLFPRASSERRYYPKFAGPKSTIEVEVIDLDSLIQELGLTDIDLLKLDVQGGELDAFRGATNNLERQTFSLIYCEIMFVPHYEGAPFFHEIWSYLSGFGYTLYSMYNLHTATNGQIRYGDGLFVSDKIRKNIINNFPEEP